MAGGSNIQAVDDAWGFSETQFAGNFFFDVRANDPLKKALHSIDNGQVADLSSADLARTAAASNDRSALGATIWITSDGRIGYSADSIQSIVNALAAGETLVDSFLYAMKQGNSIVWATVRITITGTNDAPVARADTGLALEDAVTTGTVAANDSDVDHGAVLQYAVIGQAPAGFAMAANGSWALDGSNPAYQSLPEGHQINQLVQYVVTDEHGATSTSYLTLTIIGSNDAPVVTGAVTGTAAEDGGVATLSALARASDVDTGATLSVVNVPADLPPGVSYNAATRSFTLDPSHAAYQALGAGATATVTVNYGVSDGRATTPASVSWIVTGTNDAPVASPVTAAVAEGGTVSGTLVAADADADASHVFEPYYGGPDGFVLHADGSWTFDAGHEAYQGLAEGETRELVIDYVVTDDGGDFAVSTLTLAITGTNDGPTVTGALLAAATEDDTGSTLWALANSSDAESDVLSVVDVPADLPAGVSYDAGTQSFTLDPAHAAYQSLAEGATAIVSVSYGVSDGRATTSASVSWTVTGTNDGPTASAATASVSEDGFVTGSVVVSDPDFGASLTVEPHYLSPNWFEMDSDGNWTFDANQAEYQSLAAGETREIVINFDVADAEGAYAFSTLTITIEGLNDAPVTTSQWAEASEGETATGTLLAFDQDNGALLTFTVDGEAPAGFVLGADGSWTFDTSGSVYDAMTDGEVQLVNVGFTVTDEHGAANSSFMLIALTGTNDAAVIGGTRTGSVTEAALASAGIATATGQLTISDSDSVAEFRAAADQQSLSGFGTFSLTASGAWTYTLDNAALGVERLATGQTVTDSFYAVAADGTQSLVTVTVRGANDFTAPAASTLMWGDPNDGEEVAGGWGYPDQVLTGTAGADTIVANDGNDRIYLRDGNDVAYGYVGNDTIFGEGGDDTLYGQQREDYLLGEAGNDTLYLGSGNDLGSGGIGNDTIYGGSGRDDFTGNDGDDVLIGGWGADYTRGGAGADRFVYLDLRDTNDILEDFVFGTDMLDFSALDADSAAAGNQDFAWGGLDPLAHGIWMTQVGNVVTFYADVDGDVTTAEFMVKLDGTVLGSLEQAEASLIFGGG